MFRIGQEIRLKKYNDFDEITFLSATNEELRDKINDEFGGFKAIQNVMDAVSLKNYDSFLDMLYVSVPLLSLVVTSSCDIACSALTLIAIFIEGLI